MLGRYQNFPESVHRIVHFTHKISVRKLQDIILKTFNKLNESSIKLDAVIPFSSGKWHVNFEFGVADGLTFNFIDKEEVERVQDMMSKEALSILDFFCITGITGYQTVNNGKRVPRKFDYHFLRFIFYRNGMELRIVHERGSQRIPLEELAIFIKRCINDELSKGGMRQLNLKEV